MAPYHPHPDAEPDDGYQRPSWNRRPQHPDDQRTAGHSGGQSPDFRPQAEPAAYQEPSSRPFAAGRSRGASMSGSGFSGMGLSGMSSGLDLDNRRSHEPGPDRPADYRRNAGSSSYFERQDPARYDRGPAGSSGRHYPRDADQDRGPAADMDYDGYGSMNYAWSGRREAGHEYDPDYAGQQGDSPGPGSYGYGSSGAYGHGRYDNTDDYQGGRSHRGHYDGPYPGPRPQGRDDSTYGSAYGGAPQRYYRRPPEQRYLGNEPYRQDWQDENRPSDWDLPAGRRGRH